MRSSGFIFRRIFSKFGMMVYLGKVYLPRVFGCAAPSGPSFIGSKVILGCHVLVCALTAAFRDGFLPNLLWWCI